MPPKNSGGSTKFPGGRKDIHRTAQTAFVRVVTPRYVATKTSRIPRNLNFLGFFGGEFSV